MRNTTNIPNDITADMLTKTLKSKLPTQSKVKLKILHLEDSESDAYLVNDVLTKSKLDFDILVIDTKAKFIAALNAYAPDVILSDHSLPAFNSHEALVIFHQSGLNIPFILITGHTSEEFAIDVIKRGADDYILKDRLQRLPNAIETLLEKFRLEEAQKIFLDELSAKEKLYRSLVENATDAVVLLTPEGKPTYISPSIERVLGYTETESMQMDLFSILHPDDAQKMGLIMAECLAKPGVALDAQTARMRHKDGSWRWMEGTLKNMLHDPAINGIVDNFRDVTHRVLAEEKINHANRLYNFISQINQTIVHAKNEQTLFNKVCRIAVTLGKFKAAWIGIIDKTNKKANLVEGFSLPEDDIAQYTNASYPTGGPLEYVLRTNTCYVCNNISQDPELHDWKLALKNGYGSVMVLPILKGGAMFGTFNLYAAAVNFFTETEIALLKEAAGDISFALDVFEKDELKKLAEEQVINNEKKFRALIENSVDGVTVMNANGVVLDISASSKKILGYDTKDLVGMFGPDFIHPDDLINVVGTFTDVVAHPAEIKTIEYRHKMPDGAYKWLEASFNNLLNKPFVNVVVLNYREITERKKSEELLLQSEKEQRELAEQLQWQRIKLIEAQRVAKLGSWETDLKDFKTIWSAETHNIFETDKENFDVTHPAFLQLVRADDYGKVEKAFNDSLTTTTINTIDHWIVTAKGNEKCVVERWMIFHDENGTPERAVGTCQDITERKKAEEALATTESNLQAIFENTSEGFILTDRQGIIKSFNQKSEKFVWLNTGHTLSIGSSIYNYIHESRKDNYKGVIERILAGETIRYDHAYTRENGQTFWFNFTLNPVYKAGIVDGVCITSDDITNRKEAEEEVRLISERLQIATEATGIGIWDWDVVNDILEWDGAMYEIFGIKKEDFSGAYEAWAASVHPDDIAKSVRELESALKGETKFDTEFRIIWPDKTVRYVKADGLVMRNDAGNAVRMIGTNLDITERKKAEQLIVQSESNLKAIIDNTDAMIYSLDKNFRYITFNQSMQKIMKELYGFDLQPGVNVFEFLEKNDPAEAQRWRDIYSKALTGEIVKFEKEFTLQDFYSCTNFSIYPIWDGKDVIGVSCYVQDITKEKEEHLQKERMSTDLVQRYKNLEQFSYIVSHNLRAPAANIIGLSNALNDEGLSEHHKKIFAKELQTSVRRLDEVIRDLNHIMQVKRDINENKEVVVFSKLVSNIQDSISDLIHTQHVDITTDFAAVDEMSTIKSYLYSIFYNLISNSIKYKKPGQAPRIEIRSEKQNDKITLYFKDHGTGIDLKSNGDKVFGLYKRFHQNIEGKGMGLFMVKTQVETLGGTIQLSSCLGEGTEFKIQF